MIQNVYICIYIYINSILMILSFHMNSYNLMNSYVYEFVHVNSYSYDHFIYEELNSYDS